MRIHYNTLYTVNTSLIKFISIEFSYVPLQIIYILFEQIKFLAFAWFSAWMSPLLTAYYCCHGNTVARLLTDEWDGVKGFIQVA